jgi:hypothetical protein
MARLSESGLGLPPGNVLLVCAGGHYHAMAYDQAERLKREPCIWCGELMVNVIHGPRVPVRIQLEEATVA